MNAKERARVNRDLINAAAGARPNDPEVERVFLEECAARGVSVARDEEGKLTARIDLGDEEHASKVTDGKFTPPDLAKVSEAILATRARFGLPATTERYRRMRRMGPPPCPRPGDG